IRRVGVGGGGGRVTHAALRGAPEDATPLRQLLKTLIGNAIKFKKPDEPIRVHVGASDAGTEWRFSVSDNGIGIEAQYYQRIFMVFQRLHTRDEYPGTGIGLAICKKVVDRHRGRIWVEAAPGKGSTSFFTLLKKQKGEA